MLSLQEITFSAVLQENSFNDENLPCLFQHDAIYRTPQYSH